MCTRAHAGRFGDRPVADTDAVADPDDSLTSLNGQARGGADLKAAPARESGAPSRMPEAPTPKGGEPRPAAVGASQCPAAKQTSHDTFV